jgi:hypothetical protein
MENRKRGEKKKIENEKRDHQKNHFHACCSKGKQEEKKKRLRVREKEKEGEGNSQLGLCSFAAIVRVFCGWSESWW